MSKLVLLALVIVLQVCVSTAQSPPNDNEDAPGLLQRAKEAYRELKTTITKAGSTVADYVSMYYEDHVKASADPYFEWASEKAGSLWDQVKQRVSSYTSD